MALLLSHSKFWSRMQQDPNILCGLNSATVAMVTAPCVQPVEDSEMLSLFSCLRREVWLRASHRQEMFGA